MRDGEPSAENGCGVRGKRKDDTKKEKRDWGDKVKQRIREQGDNI